MIRPFLLLLLLTAGVLGGSAQDASPDAVQVRRDIVVKARDGVGLATDLYLPANASVDGAHLPVILHRTPYDKASPAIVSIARYFAAHDYAVLVQDTRGRHHSEGVFEKYYKYDAYDGYDTIEWAARQPFSNGRLGMWGTSYAAHTQADAAKLAPPHLTTMFLNMGGMSSAWDHSVRYDGAFEMGRQLTWAWSQALEDAKDPVVKAELSAEKVEDWYSALPLRPGLSPLAIVPKYEGYYEEESTESDYNQHWASIGMNWENFYAQTADVPMMHVSGWYDIYLRGSIQNWRTLSGMKKQPEFLMLGPWTHHGNKRRFAGDVDFGPAAAIEDFDTAVHLRWFDHYLKDRNTAVQPMPVRYFLMGTGDGSRTADGRLEHGGEWRDSPVWPPANARTTTFFLHGNGSLSTTSPAAGESASTTYRFDPEHPVPTIGGGVSNRLKDGAFDQRERKDMPGSRPPYLPLRSRQDVLVFETEPLAEDVVVAGPVEVTLHASTNRTDTDFTAKLVDVYPPSAAYPGGFDMNLTDGILRGRYRNGAKVQRLMKPGEVYKLTIRPFDTANVFKKGHRIRVDISSSNFPRFDVNPNTGEPLGRNRRTLPADNTIYFIGPQASTVTISVLPR